MAFAIAMHRQIHCPSDGGEGGPVVLRGSNGQPGRTYGFLLVRE